jgi:hypothetical protein
VEAWQEGVGIGSATNSRALREKRGCKQQQQQQQGKGLEDSHEWSSFYRGAESAAGGAFVSDIYS